MVKIDERRFLEDVEEFGKIGSLGPGLGRTRLALTDSDVEARNLFAAKLKEIGARLLVDKFGNMAGILEGKNGGGVDGFVAAGSHLDTVASGGALDGAYGVLAGLAVLRAIKESGIEHDKSVGVINFTNEEGGRFRPGLFGSTGIAGRVEAEKLLGALDKDGVKFSDDLKKHGFDGKDTIRPGKYLEIHIEQGPVLEAERKKIGVVEGIPGIIWQSVSFKGQASHAGAFPMHLRRDAFAAMADFSVALRECVGKIPAAVGTIGVADLFPKVANVVPERVEFVIDARAPGEEKFALLKKNVEATLNEIAARGKVELKFAPLQDAAPVVFSQEMTGLVERAAQAETSSFMRMISGAGHDAQLMHFLCPTGMIFVPSKNGLSHCPQEDTEPEDLLLGVRVLARAILESIV